MMLICGSDKHIKPVFCMQRVAGSIPIRVKPAINEIECTPFMLCGLGSIPVRDTGNNATSSVHTTWWMHDRSSAESNRQLRTLCTLDVPQVMGLIPGRVKSTTYKIECILDMPQVVVSIPGRVKPTTITPSALLMLCIDIIGHWRWCRLIVWLSGISGHINSGKVSQWYSTLLSSH